MGHTIDLRTGSANVRLYLPAGADTLNIREPEKRVTRDGFASDLNSQLKSLPIENRRIALVVADKTRLCGYDRYLPVLLNALEQKKAKKHYITLYIAYGTHPKQNDEESRAAYGNLFSRYRFVHHDCTDNTLFTDLGTTRRGTPIRIRKDILDADVLITFGAVSHHYFAGYGGGRKLIFPGLGEKEAIYRNHSLFLDPEQRTLSAGCRPGNLKPNPLAEDLADIEGHRIADLAIHGIIDSHGRVCRLMAGSGADHFTHACALHGENCEITDGGGYDMVVASCGGHPKDINFIQAHKAVHHAAAFVKDGGCLVVFAQCKDGIGSKTFLPWFGMGGWDATFDHLSRNYQGNGGTALAMMEKTRRIDIFLVTDLSSKLCRTIGATRLSEPEAVSKVRQHGGSLGVIPNASLLVKR